MQYINYKRLFLLTKALQHFSKNLHIFNIMIYLILVSFIASSIKIIERLNDYTDLLGSKITFQTLNNYNLR